MPRIEGVKTGIDRYGNNLYAPIVVISIEVGSLHKGGLALIDSGAAYTIIPAEIAALVGIKYEDLEGEEAGEGAGGDFLMRRASAIVRWRGQEVCDWVYVAQPKKLPSPLLGRIGFFDRFSIQFNWHLRPPESWVVPPDGEDPSGLGPPEPPETISA